MLGVASGIPRLARRDVGPGAQNGDGSAQLVRRVGHEAPHPLHRPRDGRGRLTHQHVAATCHEHEGDQGSGD
ncbi:MAG: hypothetical protein DMD61_00090 [Gemmatimonadetes bacterium]|nr:MAG: hypothetical protein DMD61_00090 [Gemmatimonadota bacterium]